MSSLRLLDDTTIGTSVSKIRISDVFSSDFDIYQITFDGTDTANDTDIDLMLVNANGSLVTSTNYEYANLRLNSNSSFTEMEADQQSKWLDFMGKGGNDSGESCQVVAYIFNPYRSDSYTYALTQSSNGIVAISQFIKGIAILKEQSTITGFEISINSGATTGGSVRVYGLRSSS